MDMPIESVAAPAAPAAPVAAQPAAKPAYKSNSAKWKAEIEGSRTIRQTLVDGVWKENVEYRRGKPHKTQSDTDRVSVPVDWSFTKSKEAGLFSQVPTVRLEPAHERFRPAVPIFQKELNDVLTKQVKVDVTMEEALADLINASGVAGIDCGYLATFEDSQVPSQDLSMIPKEQHQALFDSGEVKMLPALKRVDCRFYGNRLSPSQLLWPKFFKGSDFDDADWVGYDGTCTWAQALREFKASTDRPKGLTDAMKTTVCGGADKPQSLAPDSDTAKNDDDQLVSFTRIYYWAARQDPNETKLEKIRTLVFVQGIDEPIIDEDLKWQRWSPETESFIGVTKFPLRIATLTYISDMPVPPSDSEMGRPQVDETMRSRSQMILQRDRSYPMRWANVNRVDPMILQNMLKGDYQQIIPVNGDGQSAIGETARANYPGENWEFDRVTKQDLMDSWQVGPNQTGSFNTSGRTAAEANIVQGGFQTRQAKERGKIGKLFCGIAEVIAGLMQMFYDGPKEATLIGDDGVKRIDTAWDRKSVSGHKFVYSIREDSTVKLDSQQRIDQVTKFLNIAGKSGVVNVQEIIGELAMLSGLDPAKVIIAPPAKAPEPANISLRASSEDLRDPIVGPYLIALMQQGHKVTVEDVEAGKQLLIKSSSPAEPPPAAPGMPPAPTPGQSHVPQPPDNYGPMERVTKRTEAGDFGG